MLIQPISATLINPNNYQQNKKNYAKTNLTFGNTIQANRTRLKNLLKETLTNSSTILSGDSQYIMLHKIIQYNKQLVYLEQEFNKLNEILFKVKKETDLANIEKFLSKMTELNKDRGFGRLIGYDDIKVLLTNNFIFDSMMKDKTSIATKVPNAVLFFGPNSNGKSTFAIALAEQSLANLKILDAANHSEAESINILKIFLQKSRQDYLLSGCEKQRTIILINEAEFIENPEFESIASTCSEKYNATLFLTTNHPEFINKNLLDNQITPIKVGIAPPDKDTAYAILNKKIGTKDGIEEIISLLFANPNKRYSNGMICKLIEHALMDNSKDIVRGIKKNINRDFSPNITEEEMNLFNQYKTLLKAY